MAAAHATATPTTEAKPSRPLFISSHPVLQHKLTLLRQKDTPSNVFRTLLKELTFYLGYEATTDFKLSERKFETPVASGSGHQLATRVAIVPILRSGLGMVDAMLELLPSAQVHHIGMYREHGSLCPVMYYNRLPPTCDVDIAIVLEPIIATAGTVNATLGILKDWGVTKIRVMCIVASQAGLDALHADFPDVQVHVGAVDAELTESGYIVPGLGDIGDRMWRTLADKPEPATGGIRLAGPSPGETNVKRRREE